MPHRRRLSGLTAARRSVSDRNTVGSATVFTLMEYLGSTLPRGGVLGYERAPLSMTTEAPVVYLSIAGRICWGMSSVMLTKPPRSA